MADDNMVLLCKDEVYAIVGAAFEVYNTLGPGFLEAIYHEALGIELMERGIPIESEKKIRIDYRGKGRGCSQFTVMRENLRLMIFDFRFIDHQKSWTIINQKS